MQAPPFRIAIVGAGTAGLAAAAALARKHHVQLFERFEAPKPVGAGLLIQPTGLACLAALGVAEAALHLGHVIHRIHGVTARGRTIFDVDYRDLGSQYFGLAMHRAALFDVLWAAVTRLRDQVERPLQLATGIDVVATELGPDGEAGPAGRGTFPRRRWLRDAHGMRYGPFDYVVDASGLRSRLRAGEAAIRLDRPYPYGAVWGALELPADWPHRHALTQRYDGAHTMCGILPIGRRPGEATERAAFFWSLRVADMAAWKAGDIGSWKTRVRNLWPDVAPFLDQIATTSDLTGATYADVWLRRPYQEQLIFIGDAARAASPQLGQGANLALIDALALAEALSAEGTRVPLERERAYAARRKAHTRFYGLASRALTPFFQSDSRLAALVRDATFMPMARVPYIRREMIRTLAGMKTGLFTAVEPDDVVGHRDP